MKKVLTIVMALLFVVALSGCEETDERRVATNSKEDVEATMSMGDALTNAQPTPTDIDYSLERYNLIKRTYWVNGQREKAMSYPCAVDKPLGYVVLFTDNGAVVGSFIVDGKITSLNSFLTPDSEYYELIYGGTYTKTNSWLPDVDGSYGENDSGIFFFTPDGKYIEWTGAYLYSDIPFVVDDPIVRVGGAND